MFTVLHSWRRQTGCITLVMAILVTAPWMRSYLVADRFEGAIAGRHHEIRSRYGRLTWAATNQPLSNKSWVWTTRSTSWQDAHVSPPLPPWFDPGDKWKMRRSECSYWTIATPSPCSPPT